MSRLVSSGVVPEAFSGEEAERASQASYKAPKKRTGDSLSPADAVQHMREVAQQLSNWRSGVERASD
jgi:hypothetical protein